MSDERLLLTVPEAARRLSISRAKAYELLAAGEIASVKIGRSRRVPLAACEEYVERLSHPSDLYVHAARSDDRPSREPESLNKRRYTR